MELRKRPGKYGSSGTDLTALDEKSPISANVLGWAILWHILLAGAVFKTIFSLNAKLCVCIIMKHHVCTKLCLYKVVFGIKILGKS